MREPSLSTMWTQRRFDRLADFFAAGRAMGFTHFELGHTLTLAMFDGIAPGQEAISSVHDPCPRPPRRETAQGSPALLSSTDEEARTRAVAVAQATIETAHRFGAEAVVLHLGRVEADQDLETRLRQLYQQGLAGTAEYVATRERLVAARMERALQHLEAVAQSLAALVPHARQRGIALGLENRYYYLEIPSHEEMAALLEGFDEATVFYWHDTGHAQVLANLGFTPQEEWLRSFSSRMAGIHFHDVRGIKDHLIPGTGELDFAALAPYVPRGAIRTCEFDWPFTAQEIVAGVEYLRKTGCLPAM
ncbi:MAG: sugar phosphate isomerase/epimerase family protein [Anaerolineae bacterium]